MLSLYKYNKFKIVYTIGTIGLIFIFYFVIIKCKFIILYLTNIKYNNFKKCYEFINKILKCICIQLISYTH